MTDWPQLPRGEFMLHLNLNIRKQTARRLKKVLEYSRDEETFAQNIIAYQIAEIKRALLNIRLDLQTLEEKYQISSQDFSRRYASGELGDDEDFMTWAGLVEMLANDETRLQGLEG
jgi:hypothetical protein